MYIPTPPAAVLAFDAFNNGHGTVDNCLASLKTSTKEKERHITFDCKHVFTLGVNDFFSCETIADRVAETLHCD